MGSQGKSREKRKIMTEQRLQDLETRMGKALDVFRQELAGLRIGRASAGLLEPIVVEAYGQRMPIAQLGTISVPSPRLIAIQVWDESQAAAVEKAVRESKLGLNPQREGALVRVPLPELNEERRAELVRVAHHYAEQARIAVRHIRRDGMEQIKKDQLSEDERKAEESNVQDLTDRMVGEIDSQVKAREEEIRRV